MARSRGETVRVDKLFVMAVLDRKKKMEKKYKAFYKTEKKFTFKEVTAVFGGYYFEEVFGDIPIEKCIHMIKEAEKKRW